jgi:TonB family protein
VEAREKKFAAKGLPESAKGTLPVTRRAEAADIQWMQETLAGLKVKIEGADPVVRFGVTNHLNGIWHMESIRFTLSRMSRRSLILMLAFASVGSLSSPVLENSLAHPSDSSDAAQSGVVLANLSRPVYPLLPRRTLISGDVNLLLQIRRDGSVESAVIVSGHPLLQQAALESAQQSQFDCRGCTEAVNPYSMVYTFQLFGKDCHATTNGPSNNAEQDAKPRAQVNQSQNHVSVLDEGGVCEGVFTRRVRSAKCLYLWKCGWHT